jgi:hypothetical protein
MVANTDSTPPTCPCSNTLRKPDNNNTEQSTYHKHWTAQKLNNQAASYIDVGCYDKAVALLVDALCLSPLSASKTSSPACPCSQCTLEECIAYSEERASRMKLRKQQKQRMVGKKRSIDGVVINSSSSSAETQPDDDEPQEGYIHKRPIRVTPTTIREGHVMGSTLSLIVTFNLALANHLKALTYKDSLTTTNACSRTRDTLRKVLRLYELAYKWQAELSQPQQQQPRYETVTATTSVASAATSKQAQPSSNNEANTTSSNNTYCTSNSLRFDMIVCNNLSQIHKMANNSLKQEKCLEHLLSIILFVVDWQRESSGQQQQHHHQETEGPPRRRRRLESTASNNTSSSSDRCEDQEEEEEDDAFVVQKRKASPEYMDLDGFLHNVAPLVLKNQCATAA